VGFCHLKSGTICSDKFNSAVAAEWGSGDAESKQHTQRPTFAYRVTGLCDSGMCWHPRNSSQNESHQNRKQPQATATSRVSIEHNSTDIFECRRNARDLGMIEQSSETFFERRWVSKITGTFNGDDFI
jgi:hypothetical protein